MEIARTTETSAVPASTLARQGDILLSRTGEPRRDPHTATPPGGVQIAAGRHGEHRLIGEAVCWGGDGGTISLRAPALLVHTDVPHARHETIRLAPGTWSHWREREMTVDAAVVEVRD